VRLEPCPTAEALVESARAFLEGDSRVFGDEAD
jgi:hypothetical protein